MNLSSCKERKANKMLIVVPFKNTLKLLAKIGSNSLQRLYNLSKNIAFWVAKRVKENIKFVWRISKKICHFHDICISSSED